MKLVTGKLICMIIVAYTVQALRSYIPTDPYPLSLHLGCR